MTEANYPAAEKEKQIERRFQLAKDIAQEAGKILLAHQEHVEIVHQKEGPGNIVTQADLESEKIILLSIQTEFPDDSILSEEVGAVEKKSQYLWVIDPLDGTISFASGLESFGVTIGLLDNLQPVFGVIYLPAKNELFYARKGKEAFLNGSPIQVRAERPIDKAVVAIDYGYDNRSQDFKTIFASIVDHVTYVISFANVAFASCQLAQGKIDAYLHPRKGLFESGAIIPIIQEAGGVTTPYDWTKESQFFLASSSPNLHQQLLDLLGRK